MCISSVNEFNPPISFKDSFFDCIFSVSIWTHLPPAMGMEWLNEMWRITNKGGIVLITTGGYKALKKCKKKQFNKNWFETSETDLQKNKVLFKEYSGVRNNPESFPGVTDSYGLTMYDPDYIRENWGKLFHIIDIIHGCIADLQDLIIMKKVV